MATQQSIPGKTPKAAVYEKSGSGSGENGVAGLLEGQFGADHPLGEKIVLGWMQMGVYFYAPEGQKLIPDESSHFSGTLDFMRVWLKKNNCWQIVAGSVSG